MSRPRTGWARELMQYWFPSRGGVARRRYINVCFVCFLVWSFLPFQAGAVFGLLRPGFVSYDKIPKDSHAISSYQRLYGIGGRSSDGSGTLRNSRYTR